MIYAQAYIGVALGLLFLCGFLYDELELGSDDAPSPATIAMLWPLWVVALIGASPFAAVYGFGCYLRNIRK